MRVNRRYLTFSLRTLFVLLTALAVWLGVVVHQAREQPEAVKAIEAMGGLLWYDCELVYLPVKGNSQPWPRPIYPERPKAEWPWSLLADDYSHEVWMVDFGFVDARGPVEMQEVLLKSIPHLKRLHGLQAVFCGFQVSNETLNQMQAALPNCDVRRQLEH